MFLRPPPPPSLSGKSIYPQRIFDACIMEERWRFLAYGVKGETGKYCSLINIFSLVGGLGRGRWALKVFAWCNGRLKYETTRLCDPWMTR